MPPEWHEDATFSGHTNHAIPQPLQHCGLAQVFAEWGWSLAVSLAAGQPPSGGGRDGIQARAALVWLSPASASPRTWTHDFTFSSLVFLYVGLDHCICLRVAVTVP